MQVPVPGVEDVGYPQVVPTSELGDLAQYRGELRARDDAVLDVVVVGDAAHSTESGLAGFPEEGAFIVVLGHPDLGGLVLLADLQHPPELFLDLSFRSIQLDDEHRAGVGQAWMHGRLDRLHGQAIHHLDGGGDYPLADDTRDRTACPLGVFEARKQGSHRLRDAAKPERDPGGDTQRPLRADESAEQVVARRIWRPSATDVRYRAVREHDLRAHHVVRCNAVLQAVDAAGVLDHDALVRDVHLQNLAHPGEHDQNA